jgi:hypothetical protein
MNSDSDNKKNGFIAIIKGAKIVKSRTALHLSRPEDEHVKGIQENKRPSDSLIAKKNVNFSGHLIRR